MFGAELQEFILFLRQLGLALAGASALWGATFFFKSRRSPEEKERLIYGWFAEKLVVLFTAGFLAAAISWVVLLLTQLARAHEGITLVFPEEVARAALGFATPVFWLWVIFSAAGLAARKYYLAFFHVYLGYFYIIQLVFAGLLMALGAWSGEVSREQFFFWGHSLHSIFTLGTVLVLDFLFAGSRRSEVLKQYLYPWFPAISKVVWVGLGIDFLSSFLVFEEAFRPTPKFFFMQTAVGIVIINGVLLSGPVARRLINSVRQGGAALGEQDSNWNPALLTRRWELIVGFAGVISLASWSAVTFVDFFQNLTLSYGGFVLVYFLWIGVLFLGHAFQSSGTGGISGFNEAESRFL